MALYYLDTSALAKRYVRETGSHWVDVICLSESVTTSSLSHVEIASTLARRVREGILPAAAADVIYRQFRTDEQGYAVISLNSAVLTDAAELLIMGKPDSRLRSLDAIHLACARSAFAPARVRGMADAFFVTSDRHLAVAAARAGVVVVNPEEM